MYNFRIYPFIIFLLIITCCAKSDEGLGSNYATENPTFIEKVNYTLEYGKWTWTIGNKLTLNKDSTFEMSTCANYIKGRWYPKADTLFLHYQEMTYRIDSLNYIKEWKDKLSVNGKITYYLIKGEHLERVFMDAKKRYVITKLGEMKLDLK